mgnify:FL=1|jgi:hypothetical protein
MTDILVKRINMDIERYYFMRESRMDILMTLEKANNIEKELLQKIKEEQKREETIDNSCSICMESLDNKNIVNTKCKHKFCLSCIINNHNYNKNTGNLCSICRTELL